MIRTNGSRVPIHSPLHARHAFPNPLLNAHMYISKPVLTYCSILSKIILMKEMKKKKKKKKKLLSYRWHLYLTIYTDYMYFTLILSMMQCVYICSRLRDIKVRSKDNRDIHHHFST